MIRKKTYLLRVLLLLSDFSILNTSYCGAYLFFSTPTSNPAYFYNLLYLVIFNVLWLLCAALFKLYEYSSISLTENIYRRTWRTFAMQLALFSGVYYWFHPDAFNHTFYIVCYTALGSLILLNRFLLTYITEFVFKTVTVKKKIAIVGFNENGRRLAEYFNEHKNYYSLAGFFDHRQYAINAKGKLIGAIEDCVDFAIEHNIAEIYSTILPDEDVHVNRLAEVAEDKCVRVWFVTDSGNLRGLKTFHPVDFIREMPVMSLRAEPLQRSRNSLRKRVFDIVFSLFAIVFLLSWLTPVLAVIIKLTSKGPVFFRQQRSGKDNQPFWCYKFRSMTMNSCSDSVQAVKNDSRITAIGSFMRNTSLDELPQFFNVLIGNMSIIGPRPHMLMHTEIYSTIIKKYMVRHFLKPGITGLAQVNGYRGETANPHLMQKRVEYDIAYMENWSLMLDIKIIFMTLINIFKGEKNAY